MSTLIDNPEFSANEIYELQQTDQVQGAALGANFGGIGNDNQPHQQLANRTALLYNRQQINITNIGVLQAFQALFTGTMGTNGIARIPFFDSSRGLIQYILQWGTIPVNSLPINAFQNTVFSQSFAQPFPNACVGLFPYWQCNSGRFPSPGPFQNGMMVVEAITPFDNSAAHIFSDWDNHAIINIATLPNDGNGLTGIGWIAWGF